MNWLFIGLALAFCHLIWFGWLISQKNYNRQLLIVAIAHFPYLLANLVAPFRGFFDSEYAGYQFGLIKIPAGIWVTIITGFIVVGSFLIASKALKNQMERLWIFTFLFDLGLLITMAGPMFFGILFNPTASNIQLGEYMTISGIWVALITFFLFAGPTLYSITTSAKKIRQTI
ncbi:hypothetical protein SAMN05421640_2757 [Ekhidna lutea]|uniref:Uncharacterized protein n=1 Tax=Ekhidna lutea TaxID=447679 RepID=A0A239KPH1_EKHLU|nr:hypothetical protein [Ekhidna lutea]SNT19074.1 hypothetical protein SAMN05421640_2757 [Ekhidna lutea]